MKIKILFSFVLFLALIGACEPKTEEFIGNKGDADFSRYIALGNSLTSGYADGALYKSAQSMSYPAILAQQFKKVGGGDFIQPIVENEDGLFDGKLVLGYSMDCRGESSLSPIDADGNPVGYPAAIQPIGYTVNNLGVPGAKVTHLIFSGYGNPLGLQQDPPTANPYFVRMASDTGASVLAEAMKQNPTFFTLWIGNNDVLGYATSGGENNTSNESITPEATFSYAYELLINTLTSNGAKGALANIPDITAIPFFNTIPAMGLLLDENAANALNEAYHQAEMLIQSMGLPNFSYGFHFKAGYNAFVIEDRNFPYPVPAALRVRQAKPNELILLTTPQDSIKCAGMGSFNIEKQHPYGIPQQFVLDEEEIANIQNAVKAYNNIIHQLATQKNLAFVDVANLLERAKSGISYDGLIFDTKYITGGVFSLDGIHLTPQGAAIVANYFIEAINKQYHTNIPKAEITQYPGITYPD
ncbi:MAG TPA: SGNH/GDSL hydrolase family protein [Bacteroidales bacterium]|nr:SGNH/GDSL hydrolase family protein [Bacteroidales bacterium]